MALLANPLIAPALPTELSYASPRIQCCPTSLFGPSPPPTRTRRSDGSSSDETPVPTVDGFVETDLRAGGPQLCESPCETLEKIPHTEHYYDYLRGTSSYGLLTELGDICHQENVRYTYMDFCGRRSIYESSQNPIITLLVYAERREGVHGGWIGLARKLWSHLRTKGIHGLSVEIIDPRSQLPPKIHPCSPSDAIFPIWEQVAADIFHAIDRTGVFTIGCFRIGSEYDRALCPPTVLLGVDRKVKRDWKRVREAVVAVLDAHALNTVAVTIRKDVKVARNGSSDIGVAVADCRRDAKLGTSLSPSSMRDSHGTLGGWIEIRNPTSGQWVGFALTCSHCCFPVHTGLPAGDLQVIEQWKRHGVSVNDTNKTRLLPVDSPSYRDVRKSLDHFTASIQDTECEPVYRQVEELKANNDFVMPYLERAWQFRSTGLTRSREDKQTMTYFLNTNAYRLGTVFAASGLREVPSVQNPDKLCIRDWALVQLGNGRAVGKNTVVIPRSCQPKGLSQLFGFHESLPAMDQRLFKVGRATGYTNGKYGNLKTCHIASQMVNGKRVEVPTWEHAIVRAGHTIVKEGDSGSLVFDENGLVLGMIFGGTGSFDVGYFTTTRDLLADIRHITGAQQVRLRYQTS